MDSHLPGKDKNPVVLNWYTAKQLFLIPPLPVPLSYIQKHVKIAMGMIRPIWVVTFLGFHFMGTDLKIFPTWSSMRTRKLCGWNELTGFGNKMRVSIQQSQTLLFSGKPCDITLFQERFLFCLGPCLSGVSVWWMCRNLRVDCRHLGFSLTSLMPVVFSLH